MKKITQTQFGDRGNCYSACIAMMLGLELKDVPNFYDGAGPGPVDAAAWYDRVRTFLGVHGYALSRHTWYADEVAHGFADAFMIVAGPSPRHGGNHAVIYRGLEPYADPHPDANFFNGKDPEFYEVLFPLAGACLGDRLAITKVLMEQIEHHRAKWWHLEQNYVLPLFAEAKLRGHDLQELVLKRPGKNCTQLFLEVVAPIHPGGRCTSCGALISNHGEVDGMLVCPASAEQLVIERALATHAIQLPRYRRISSDLAKVINRMEEEIEVLRNYGNKDCTAMADQELEHRYGKGYLWPAGEITAQVGELKP